MSSLGEFKTKDSHLLVLFIRQDCQYCAEAQLLLRDIDPNLITIKEFVVFPSRIEGMVEIKPVYERLEGLPLLLDEEEIPSVPCLFDPTLGQKMIGLPAIEQYLEDTGLVQS